MSATVAGETSIGETAVEDKSRSSRFRFKRKHEHTGENEPESRKHHRRHHHRSRRSRTDPRIDDDPSAYDDSASRLPPDTAFRESLFDAMGDDEGAAFWEGVYGQPIHKYPNKFTNEATGELEQMTDEEYAQFVRRKMWEKSWEGIEAARAEKKREREEEKKRVREEERSESRRKETNNYEFVFDIEFEQSLKRGQRRRDNKRWKTLWRAYVDRWEELQALREAHKDNAVDTKQLFLRNKIAWPVESGKRKDIDPVEVEKFIRNCTDSSGDEIEISTVLKAERIRWHPDKIQQRYGFTQIDEDTMRGVTATFQIFDKMWNDLRIKPT